MTRRPLLSCIAFLAVIGVGVGVWCWLTPRDDEFVWIGPKRKGVQATLEYLELEINAADFHECKNLYQVTSQLNRRHHDKIFGQRGDVDPKVWEAPIQIPRHPETMTIRELLREAVRQTQATDIRFVSHSYGIEVTTAARVAEDRQWYLEHTTIVERMRHIWMEMRGELAPDPELLLQQ